MSYIFLLLCTAVITSCMYSLCTYSGAFRSSIACILFSFFIGLVVAGTLFIMVPTPSTVNESDRLLVGVSGDFPPFAFIQGGKLVGFDVDLLEEIGHRINKKIEIKQMPFSALLPSLQLGALQLIASGITATPERAKQVLFTKPYLEGNPLIIVSMSSAPADTLEDLNNREVIVNEGYSSDLYMSAIKGPLLKRLQSPAQAFLALQSGRAFAFVTAQNTVKPFFDQYDNRLFHSAVIPNTDENASLAITPRNPELGTLIQDVLDEMQNDGTLDRLKTTWGL